MLEKIELRKKILKEVYVHGLYNKTKIEDRLKMNPQTINYVLKKLQEEKLFVKKRYVINLNHFDINTFAWIFISINWIEINEEGLLEKLNKLPYIHTISEVTGNYDIAIKIIAKNYEKLNEYVFNIESILSSGINDVKTYYLNKEIKMHYLKVEERKKIPLKKIDNILVLEKDNNPEINLIDIAKKHKLHRNTVSKRWGELWANTVILKKTVELNHAGYKFINLGLKAFIIINTYPGKNERVIQNLLNETMVQDVFSTISNVIIAIVRVEDSQELSIIHKKISMFSDIKRTETIIFLKKHTKSGLTSRELNLLVN